MGLETGSYIANLVATNPLGTDPKSAGDDHLRLIKNALLNCFAGFTGSIFVTGTDGGAANAYTLTPATALLAYSTRMVVAFAPTVQNTGASTLNISALGVKDIKSVSGAALVSGDLEVGTIYTAYYNGTEFRLLSITKNYADQLAFGTSLPAQAGNADKFITTDGTSASWSDLIKVGTMKFADSTDTTKRMQFDLSAITAGQTRQKKIPDRDGIIAGDSPYVTRTSNTILVLSDIGTVFTITGSGAFTQTLTAAATLGANWWVDYYNFTTGNITFDPNSGELIDGATTGILEPGMGIRVRCTGTAFVCERIGEPVKKILTSGTSGTFPLGVRVVRSKQCAGGGSGGRTNAATTAAIGANSGAFAEKQWIVSPNTAYSFAIGAGATAPNTVNAVGTAGGNTTLTVSGLTVTTNGGSAGHNTTVGFSTTRNTASSGDTNIDSGVGSTVDFNASNAGSRGGNTPMGWGEGGFNYPAGSITLAASGFGSGGSSGSSTTSAQNGQQGKIELIY